MAVQNSTGIFINGALSGDMVGIMEARLTEAMPGSQLYTVFAATASYKQLGVEAESGLLQLSGFASPGTQENYSGVSFAFMQTTVSGQMQGFYAGWFNAVGTLARISDAGNPYNGEGFFQASYVINGTEAKGYAYAIKNNNSVIAVKGMLDYPVYSRLDGVIGLGQQTTMAFTNDKLPNPDQKLIINLIGPMHLSAGQSVTYKIDVLNRSSDQTVQGRTVQVVLPDVMVFVSAAGNSTYSKDFNTVRFRLPNIPPGERYSADMQLKVKPGIGTLSRPVRIFTADTMALDVIYSHIESEIWPDDKEMYW